MATHRYPEQFAYFVVVLVFPNIYLEDLCLYWL